MTWPSWSTDGFRLIFEHAFPISQRAPCVTQLSAAYSCSESNRSTFWPLYFRIQVSWSWRGLYCVVVGGDHNTIVEKRSWRRLEHGSVNHAPLYRCAGCAGQNRLTSFSWRWNRLQIMQCDSISLYNSTERNKWMSYRTSYSADRVPFRVFKKCDSVAVTVPAGSETSSCCRDNGLDTSFAVCWMIPNKQSSVEFLFWIALKVLSWVTHRVHPYNEQALALLCLRTYSVNYASVYTHKETGNRTVWRLEIRRNKF